MNDIAAEIRDIIVFHLGVEEARLTEGAGLVRDLGADSLDVVEIMMSCEERFEIEIPTRVAVGLATVGDTIRFVEAELAMTAKHASGSTGRLSVLLDSKEGRDRSLRHPAAAQPGD